MSEEGMPLMVDDDDVWICDTCGRERTGTWGITITHRDIKRVDHYCLECTVAGLKWLFQHHGTRPSWLMRFCCWMIGRKAQP